MLWGSIFNTREQHNLQNLEEQNLIVNSTDNEKRDSNKKRDSNENNHLAPKQQPRVSSFRNSFYNFFNTMCSFFCEIGFSRKGSNLKPLVIDAQTQAENRNLLSEIIGGQRPEFNYCIKNACAKAKQDLSFINPQPKVDESLQSALLIIHRNPSSVPYTQNSLEKDLCNVLKEIRIKPHITQQLESSLAQANLAHDEDSIATLLQKHTLRIKELAMAEQNEMPQLCQRLVLDLTNQAKTLKNYTEAKNEAIQKIYTILATKNGKILEEAQQSPELEFLIAEIEKKALELEKQATIENNGELPLISKSEYEAMFNEVLPSSN